MGNLQFFFNRNYYYVSIISALPYMLSLYIITSQASY